MSRFFLLEMAREVSSYPKISVRKGFLGFFERATFIPTGSKVESYCNYYSKENAELIRDLVNSKDEDLESRCKSLGELECDEKSSFRLDLCVSDDKQFVAMQLNHVADDGLFHITPIRYLEGEQARLVETIL